MFTSKLGLVAALAVLLSPWNPSLQAAPPDEESQLIATLQSSSASPGEKDAACARLKFIGTQRCVPALAALLTDEQLSHSARYALESMHFEAAGKALVGALPRTSGLTRLGIINSLADRREPWVEPALIPLLGDPDQATAAAAARALGEIASPAAIRALQRAARQANSERYPAIVDAQLRCANRLLASGYDRRARSIFERLYNPQSSETVQVAAYRGLIQSSGNAGLRLVLRGITGPPGPAQLTSLQMVSQLQVPQASYELSRILPQLAPQLQAALIESLAQRKDPSAAPALVTFASNADTQVQVAIIQALGTLGDASTVPLLADFAANGTPEQQAAARQALTDLNRGNVNETLVSQLVNSSPGVQAVLARALGDRTARSALPSLMDLARSGPAGVRHAALDAIAVLVDNPQLPSLVELVLQAPDPVSRAEAAEALKMACQHIRSWRGQADVQPLVGAIENGPLAARLALLPLCSILPNPGVRSALRLALQDSNPQVHNAAVRAMADSTDPELLDDLVTLAQTTHDEKFRSLAIEGAVRLTIDDKDQIPNDHRVAALRELLAAAGKPEQKRVVFSGLAEVPDPDALLVVEPALNDPGVQAEAAMAAVQIAVALPSSQAQNSERVLEKALGTAPGDSVRQALQNTIKQIEANADYISDWQVAGPYRAAGKNYSALFDTIFPPELEDPKGVIWKSLPTGADPKRPWAMDLSKAFGHGTQCVAYARTWVHCDQDKSTLLELGSDDGIKVWINDKQVYALNAARALRPGSDKVPVKLHTGWNQVLLKITQNVQAWEFCARFRKPDGSHLDGLQFESVPAATTPKAAPKQEQASE